MRDTLLFIFFVVAVFVGVGEWRGWYVGVPGSTPVFVYQKDHRAVTEVRTVTRSDMPISVSGRVRRGTVTLTITYERPVSFQSGGGALPERDVFEQVYRAGQTIAFDEVVAEGRGIYRVKMTYVDASGTFRFRFPRASEL
ncbi:MAG: hypothetical protein P1P87_08655 [Trueperaceae bacterium]|nr:hypothetical protein [Trueperaceae bacterium]